MKKLKKILMLGVLLLSTTFLATACDGYEAFTPLAAWNRDGSRVLLFESRFKRAPGGDIGTGKDFQLGLHVMDVDTFRSIMNKRTHLEYMWGVLTRGRELVRYELTRQTFIYERNGAYWFQNDNLVLFRCHPDVSLFNLETKQTKILYPPAGVLAGLINTLEYPNAVSDTKVRYFAPSPDGNVIAVMYEAAYFLDGPYNGLATRQVVSYFDVRPGPEQGQHLGSYLVRLTDEPHSGITPYLTHNLEDVSGNQWLWKNQYFLWKQDSSGIFVMIKENAIEIALDGTTSDVQLVPERAIPTVGGRITDSGDFLRRVPDSPLIEYDFRLVIDPLNDWIGFHDLQLVEHDSIDYNY